MRKELQLHTHKYMDQREEMGAPKTLASLSHVEEMETRKEVIYRWYLHLRGTYNFCCKTQVLPFI